MKRLPFVSIILLLALILPLAAPAAAQEGPGQENKIPTSHWLDGIQQAYQLFNRCSAAALFMQLTYYDFEGSHTSVARFLNPNSEDVSVRLEEMQAFVEQHGLKGIARTGGTIELLKQLVAAGFPVLVEHAYYDGGDSWKDWMSHNRVVMGYDIGRIYVYDPLLGNGEDYQGRPMPYHEFDDRWRSFNRDYFIAYRPDEEEKLQTILGENWDETSNAEWTLEQAMAERETNPDSFSLFNIGAAQTVLGQYEEAAATFDEALSLGVPWRMLWYRFEPFEAYLQVGRYEDVRNLVYEVLNATSEVEEMYYYIGRAYEGQGNLERAKANYSAALYRNPHFTAATEALAALEG
jgi:tetratricopeptide (TPR) repeat protein